MRALPAAPAGIALLLAACLFETKAPDLRPGYASFSLSLGASRGALLKAAASDTAFSLDSLKIILTAPGAAPAVHAYAVSGRPDTGNIQVTAKVFTLAPLRTWQAKVLTLDAGAGAADTVHLDSTAFAVSPGDTTLVALTAAPAFSLLRVRLVSNSPGSLANNVKYVRIRVGGATRDSAPVGPRLRSVSFGSNNTGYAAGDGGIILRTANSGGNWAEVASGTSQDLHAVAFPAANTGYAVGAGGVALKTTNGTAWAAQASGTARNLNGAHFTGAGAGYAVGDGGVILKSNGTAWSAAVSGTAQNLRAAWSTSATTGYAVGDAGTIVKTTSSGGTWSALASGTARNLRAVHFPVTATGYAVGDSGTILKTTNSGSSWSPLASGVASGLTGVHFSTANTGWAAGKGGVLLKTTNGSTWTAQASGTLEDLHGLRFTPNNNEGVAAGDLGNLVRTSNGTSWTRQLFGTRSFDARLAWKRLKPGVPATLVMEAIDTLAGALRGYQASRVLLLEAGRDTTISPGPALAQCGYPGFPACAP